MSILEKIEINSLVEVCLMNGQILCGKVLDFEDNGIVIEDNSDNSLIYIFVDNNISFVKFFRSDQENDVKEGPLLSLDEAMEKDYTPRKVDSNPIIFSGMPKNRQEAIEEIKERHRHNSSFSSTQSLSKPVFKPHIEKDE